MKRIKQGIFLLAAMSGIVLTSCGDESPWSGSDEEGGIVLSVESDGRLMRGGTRADDTNCPIVPDPAAFGVNLKTKDGKFEQSWGSVEAFNAVKSFPMGAYVLTATYGDIDKEGFELPCYQGQQDVHVAPGDKQNVEVTATLANAMVSIRYTDTFLEHFPKHSAAVQTPGNEQVIFPGDETRPAFINPEGTEDTKVFITLTNTENKTVTVQPCSFKPQARHHYVVTINATGNVTSGGLVLNIEFSEEVVNETVEISLGDELFDAPAPEVRPKNFAADEEIPLIEYETIEKNPQFDLVCFGGFSEVALDVISTDYTPAFGNQVQLVNADPVVQKQLADAGVKVSGLFRNVGQMAVVNVKEFIQKLPAGEYTIQLTAKDALTRTSEPVAVKAKVTPLQIEVVPTDPVNYLGDAVTVNVNTNSSNIKDAMKFKVPNASNQMVDVVPTGVRELAAAAGAAHTFAFTLPIAPARTAFVDVEWKCGQISGTKAVQCPVSAPEYTMEVDAFARFAVVKIGGEDADLVKYVVENLQFKNGETPVDNSRISRDKANNMITIKELIPSTNYEKYKGVISTFEKSVPAFTMEDETPVPNGDFNQLGTPIYFQNIDSGGKFTTGTAISPRYQFKATIDLYEPKDWATINDFTAYSGAGNQNTWFVVPSTYIDNGVVIVRSVGYHHNGNIKESHYSAPTYSKNAPDELLSAAGELFLGTYSYNGSDSRSNGVSFASRPMSISFDYKYVPMNQEQGEAEIYVYDAEGTEIAKAVQSLSASSDMRTVTINMPSYAFKKKAAKIYVRFRSSKSANPAIHIPSGDELHQSGHNGTNTNLGTNNYKAVAVGSVLTLDNVKLGYEAEGATVTPAPRRKHYKK